MEDVKEPRKEILNDYYVWLSDSRRVKNSLPSVKYPSKYVLEATVSDINATKYADSLYNDEYIGWLEGMRNASLLCKLISYNKALVKPEWNNFDLFAKIDNWKKIKKVLRVEDSMKEILYKKYGEKYLVSLVEEELKSKEVVKGKLDTEEDRSKFILGRVETKLQLFQLLPKLLKCSSCKYCSEECPNKIFLDVNNNNQHEKLIDIKYIFIIGFPDDTDFKYNLPMVIERGLQIRKVITEALKLNSNEYFIMNLVGCKTCDTDNFYDKILECYENFEIIRSYLPSVKKIFIDNFNNSARRRFGILNDYEWYAISGKIYCISLDLLNVPLLSDAFSKKPRTNADHKITNNQIKTDLYSLSKNYQPMQVYQEVKKAEEPMVRKTKSSAPANNNDSLNEIDAHQFFKNLEPGWTYLNVSTVNKKVNTFSEQHSYIMMRKGNQKIVQYLNPKINIYYSTNPDYQCVESTSNLYCIPNVPLKFIRYNMRREEKSHTNITCWYNTDFKPSIYISDIMRNACNYQEGNDRPRVWFFDIEAEPETINVKADDERLDGKLRLFTIFDSYEKKYYVGVRKEKEYHSDNNNGQNLLNDMTEYYEETEDKKGKKVINGPYPIEVKEFYDEFELIEWFNELLVEKDPDIITGWNVEIYDLPVMLVRSKTLHCDIHTKYGYFDYKYVKNKDDTNRIVIQADGIMVIDYLTLYKSMHQNKKPKYKLDYICEIELGGNRKKNEVENDHDWMYQNRLRDYTWYNIVDVMRVYELDQLLDYFSFQTQIINITYTDWDSIYSKTRLIDGLLFNHVKKTRDAVVRCKPENITSESFQGAYVLEPIVNVYEWVVDLDLASLYPHVLTIYNISADTLVGYVETKLAENWLYNREEITYPFSLVVYQKHQEITYSVEREDQLEKFLEGKILTIWGGIFYKPEVKKSYIAEMCVDLMEKRSIYKNKKKEAMEAKDFQLTDKYNNMQLAVKSLTNSIYGAISMSSYRLFNILSARSITASGREITKLCSHYISRFLEKMLETGNIELPFETIPLDVKTFEGLGEIEDRPFLPTGDTDSVFVHLGKLIHSMLPIDATNEQKTNLCWEIVDKCQNFVNEYVIYDILRRKNIDPKSLGKYIFNYKREFIYSKCLFLSKKHYACKTIMNNGVMVDGELDIKGLNLIKSEFSAIGREVGMKVLMYILDEYDPNNILEGNRHISMIIDNYIQKVTELMKTFDNSIAKSVSKGKEIKHFKALPAQLKAIMLYEELFKREVKTAEKCYLFWLKDINWEKLGTTQEAVIDNLNKKYGNYDWFKSGKNLTDKGKAETSSFGKFTAIAIPMESNEKLDPEIFIIDEEKIYDSCVYSMVKNLVEVLGITELSPADKKKAEKKRLEERRAMDDIVL